MRFTVKQIASLAGISNRTLHYYDEVGLLHPASYGDNGYRYYGEEAVLRLQQILFYRDLGFSLDQIKTILDRPDFDLLKALAGHKQALIQRGKQIETLIETVDRTMQHIRGEIEMKKEDFYQGFDEAKQKNYAREAEQLWGEPAGQSQKRWESSSREEKNAFLAEMHEISLGLVDAMDDGPQSETAQRWVNRWYEFIDQKCYPCSLEIFESLGHMYVEDARFRKTYETLRPGMAAFMEQAMTSYCQQKR